MPFCRPLYGKAIKQAIIKFLCPNFEQVDEAYWFGPARPSVDPSVRYACTRSNTVRDRNLKFASGTSMKIKETRIFFLSIGFVTVEFAFFKVFPFFISFSLQCKPIEACKQNISRTV